MKNGYLSNRLEKDATVRSRLAGWAGRNVPTFAGKENTSALLGSAANGALEDFHTEHARATTALNGIDQQLAAKHSLLQGVGGDSPHAAKLQKEIEGLHKVRAGHIAKVEKAYTVAHGHHQNLAVQSGNPGVMDAMKSRRGLVDELKGGSKAGGAIQGVGAFLGKHKWKLLGAGAIGLGAHHLLKKKGPPAAEGAPDSYGTPAPTGGASF